MNAVFHIAAVIVLGLLVWMWSQERSKHKLVVNLLKQFTGSRQALSQGPSGAIHRPIYRQIYLRKPLDFVFNLCQAFEIPFDIEDKSPGAPKPAKIDPMPLVELILLNHVIKMTSQIKPGQKPALFIWVKTPPANLDHSTRLRAALGGDLDVAIVDGNSAIAKT